MKAWYEYLQLLGQTSLDSFWFPIGIWTFAALIAFLVLKIFKTLNPLYHYHLRVATLVAIPFALVSSAILQGINSIYTDSGTFDSAIFIVESPISYSYTSSIETAVFAPNWFEPNFLLGVFSFVLLAISLLMIFRLIRSYLVLRKLHRSLTHTPLNTFEQFESLQSKDVKVAYHDHPLVPFTFGWKQPIIVLPNSIKDDQEKVWMAVQHELVHIQRGDYLLQLLLSAIESVFWFHPLIHFGSREIEMYREISCDQEVLNTSGISLKNYASILYELVPLNRGMGSFSVSMAVQSSTLHKRIETMKYHKMYKSSLKRSLLFLVLTITAVTVPIACSDMRGPNGLSFEELEKAELKFTQFKIEVNGKVLADLSEEMGVEVGLPANNIAAFNVGENGLIAISLRQFEGAKLSGELEGNVIETNINELNFKITSLNEISSSIDRADVWVKHYTNSKSSLGFGQFSNVKSLEDRLNASMESKKAENEDYFVVVEEMPKLIGGLSSIQSKVEYPTMAKRAGIEGRVTVQFIVNENGDVENPKIIRGIGGGCDEAALEAVKLAKFEPGIQRGKPVRVQYSLPVIFRLTDSDFNSNKDIIATLLSYSKDSIRLKITNTKMDPLPGANVLVAGTTIGAVANEYGNVTITGVDLGRQEFIINFTGLNTAKFYHTFSDQ